MNFEISYTLEGKKHKLCIKARNLVEVIKVMQKLLGNASNKIIFAEK